MREVINGDVKRELPNLESDRGRSPLFFGDADVNREIGLLYCCFLIRIMPGLLHVDEQHNQTIITDT